MKIDQFSNTGVYGPRPSGLQGTQSMTASNRTNRYGPAAESMDRVEVSDLAQRVSTLMETEAAGRASMIMKLREVYESGTYRADSAAISNMMIDEALSARGIGLDEGDTG